MTNTKKTTTALSTINRNWAISTRSQSHGLYRLALIATSGLHSRVINRLFKDFEPTEFIFDINPQSIVVAEPAATTVVPTQNGGHFRESQGQIFKGISISGTTGLRPNQRGGQIIPIIGLPNPFSNPALGLNGLPKGELSGFERIIQLRNLFRKYWDAKTNPDLAAKIEMVWENGKEGEFYIVEPMVFRTPRTSGSPLTSAYELQLKTMSRLETSVIAASLKFDPLRNRTALSKAHQRYAQWMRSLNNAFLTVEGLVDKTVGIAQSTVNSILAPTRIILDGLANITSAATRVLELPRSSVRNLVLSANNLIDEIEKTRMAVNAYKTEGKLTDLSRLARGLRRISRTCAALHKEDSLFSQSIGAVYNRRKSPYVDPVTGPTLSGGSQSSLSNASTPVGTFVSKVGGADTIFSISLRELGDQARWKELVILNNLEAPYVDSSGDGISVLRPQDTILIPGSPSGGSNSVGRDITEGSALVKRLGRDLKLVKVEGLGGVDLRDLKASSTGDAQKVEGVPNIVQATFLKFSTPRGSLPLHPLYGLELAIGKKQTTRSLIGFSVDAQATLGSDSRISNVSQISFKANGNLTTVLANVSLTGIDEQLTVSFDTKR